jgi:cytochrome P450
MGADITRTMIPAGREAWRVSRYKMVKALMEDRRLAMEHPDPAANQWFSDSPMHRVLVRLAAHPIPGRAQDQAERAQRRASMTRMFSPQNIHRSMPDIQTFADDLLDTMTAQEPLANLTDTFSVPLCARVVCDLLNVPGDDIALFRRWADDKDDADLRRSLLGLRQLMTYVTKLIRLRQAEPGDDIVSALLAGGADGDEFHEGRITNLVAWILGLGWQVAASAIDYGVLLLVTHPEQRRLLETGSVRSAAAVEEVLRHFNATSAAIGGLDRYAHADIEIGGVTIRTGDMVLLDVPAANRDPEVFPNPDEFDIGRNPNPHLTFGHGFYHCNFNRVARSEVEVGLTALFGRLPTLRLAVDPAELEFKQHPQSGVVGLPVAW